MHAYERSARKTASEATPYGCRKKSARGRPAPLIVFRLFFTMIGRDRMQPKAVQGLPAVNGPPPTRPATTARGAIRDSRREDGKRQVAAATRSCDWANPGCRRIAKFL